MEWGTLLDKGFSIAGTRFHVFVGQGTWHRTMFLVTLVAGARLYSPNLFLPSETKIC